MLHSKQPPVARKFSGSVPFELGFERNCDIAPALFDRGAELASSPGLIFRVRNERADGRAKNLIFRDRISVRYVNVSGKFGRGRG